MEKIWGSNDKYKFTSSVTLKALIRVLADLTLREDLIEKWRDNPTPRVFEKLVSRWADLKDELTREPIPAERFLAFGLNGQGKDVAEAAAAVRRFSPPPSVAQNKKP